MSRSSKKEKMKLKRLLTNLGHLNSPGKILLKSFSPISPMKLIKIHLINKRRSSLRRKWRVKLNIWKKSIWKCKAGVGGLFLVKEEIPLNKFQGLLLKGGTLVDPDSLGPIRQGILTVGTANTFLHENEIDNPKKVFEAIRDLIIKEHSENSCN